MVSFSKTKWKEEENTGLMQLNKKACFMLENSRVIVFKVLVKCSLEMGLSTLDHLITMSCSHKEAL
jgi:hypothetical protein